MGVRSSASSILDLGKYCNTEKSYRRLDADRSEDDVIRTFTFLSFRAKRN